VSGRSHRSLKFKLLNTLLLSGLCVVRLFCSGGGRVKSVDNRGRASTEFSKPMHAVLDARN